MTSTLLGVLIAAEASGKLHWAYPGHFPRWSWKAGVAGFVMLWLPVLFVLIRRYDRPGRRRSRGECVACGYPLLKSYNCPECGTLRAGNE